MSSFKEGIKKYVIRFLTENFLRQKLSESWKLDNHYFHEQPGLESDPSSAISGLPGNVNLELLQQATSYLNSAISGSGSDAGSAVNEDPGFHEHVNSLRDTMFYVCQVCKLDLL